MFARRRATAMVAVLGVVAVAALAACGGDSDPEPPPSPATTEPAVTAPPALTPEEEAEAEIKATFEDLVASWDAFKINASDYRDAAESTWNADLVGTWPVEGQANLELTNWVAAWRNSAMEQRAATAIRTHAVGDLSSDADGTSPASATSSACLDLTALKFVTYDGGEADLTFEPDLYQQWAMTWLHHESETGGTQRAGWRVQSIELTRNEPC
ncbi:hypothetical protein [Jiangella mangrovi]|uniref:Nuclear transport factor 2 family protein n=1 Tax=Jiangella mangrovi TaxID=1524084 RepID=A0A7W9LNV1_9ACTN|nr:hypothetical protein [Jiangella mangrovi]MBB5790512.1 hypothetical protein [Jiangella mangrovi]